MEFIKSLRRRYVLKQKVSDVEGAKPEDITRFQHYLYNPANSVWQGIESILKECELL